jgi:hypothetical protein
MMINARISTDLFFLPGPGSFGMIDPKLSLKGPHTIQNAGQPTWSLLLVDDPAAAIADLRIGDIGGLNDVLR